MERQSEIRAGGPARMKALDGAALAINGAGEYKDVSASSSAAQLGATGALNDYLHRLLVTVNTAGATATLTITDGATTITLSPSGGFAATGIVPVDLGLFATTPAGWKVTTGAGLKALAIGNFS